MGLTRSSAGRSLLENVRPSDAAQRRIVLAGNPNVGKSSLFNALTGMHQHTGNWPGKTVAVAQGELTVHGKRYALIDAPGTYSLSVRSPEEEIAADLICFGEADAVMLVCDATALERNLYLVMQVLECTEHTLVCVNLIDEAKRKGIRVNTARLAQLLGVRTAAVSARDKKSLQALPELLERTAEDRFPRRGTTVELPPALENAAAMIAKALPADFSLDRRWAALRILEEERWLDKLGLRENDAVNTALDDARSSLASHGYVSPGDIQKEIAAVMQQRAAVLARECVQEVTPDRKMRDESIDRLLTGRFTGYLAMLLLLGLLFWLTISGANYPSELLSRLLFGLEDMLMGIMERLHAPPWLSGSLIEGAYRMTAWVVSVMLPPMAIFFPLFTLLEDVGYLPRVAFALDRPFHRCGSCGKQALTMAMGFGCNAAGVVGCRIIDSPRERKLAVVTNGFMPCNGRFPMLISLLTMFFAAKRSAFLSSVSCAALLTALVLLAIAVTFLSDRLLSATVWKGESSAFLLELPPYRQPQWGKVLVRSVLDRTLYVLGRAICAAAPAGLLLWLLANLAPGNESLLHRAALALDGVGRFFGMDGVILLAFLLGLPANETVIPIMLMIYLSKSSLSPNSAAELRSVLLQNGWTVQTALCVLLFTVFHSPCATTLLTIRKETKSSACTALAALLPTFIGAALCLLVRLVAAI